MEYTVHTRDDLFNFVEHDYERGNWKDKENVTDCSLLAYLDEHLKGYTIRYIEVLLFDYPYCIVRFDVLATFDMGKGPRISREIGIDGHNSDIVPHITDLLRDNSKFIEYAKRRSKKNKPVIMYKQVI